MRLGLTRIYMGKVHFANSLDCGAPHGTARRKQHQAEGGAHRCILGIGAQGVAEERVQLEARMTLLHHCSHARRYLQRAHALPCVLPPLLCLLLLRRTPPVPVFRSRTDSTCMSPSAWPQGAHPRKHMHGGLCTEFCTLHMHQHAKHTLPRNKSRYTQQTYSSHALHSS